MSKQALLLILIAITAVFFLAGCGADIDRRVTFLRDEAWEAEMEFGLPAQLMMMLGSPESFEAELAEGVAEWEASGADVSWDSRREDTALIYTFEVKGTGLALLNEIVFDDEASMTAVEIEGQRQIQFSYFVSGDLLDANSNTLTLEGGEVLSSNGTALNRGTVQWVNPRGRVEAVLTEKSGSGLGSLLLFGLLLAGVGGAGWYFWKQRQQTQLQMQSALTFCANCGTPLNPQAKFCPNCGQQQS